MADVPPPKEQIGTFAVFALGTFGLLALAWFSWTPLSTAMRAALARNDTRKALEAVTAKDWPLAAKLLTEANRRAPGDPEVLRGLIEFHKATGSDPAGMAQRLKMLDEIQPLTAAERLLLAEALIATGKLPEAKDALERVPQETEVNARRLELQAAVLKAEGHTQEAQAVVRHALNGQTNDPQVRLQASQENMRSAFPEVRQQGREELWETARLKTEVALPAIQALLKDASLTAAQASELLALAESHPLKPRDLTLGAVSALMRLKPEQRTALVREQVRRFTEEGQGTREETAVWLMREREYDELRRLVPASLAVKSRELYPILMQTLAQQQRWKELEEFLTAPNPPVDRGLVTLALAEVKAHLEPDKREARLLIDRTIEAAKVEGNLPVLRGAAGLAEKHHLADSAALGYQAAAEKANAAGQVNDAVSDLQKAATLALAAKNTEVLLSAFRKLHELRPSSSAFAEEFVYLRLVLGVEIETVDLKNLGSGAEVVADAQMTVDRMPPELLQALVAYRLGDTETMRANVASLQDASRLPAGQRAVVAGLLSMAGKVDRAYQIAEKIPGGLLLDEEMVFLKKAL